MSDELTWRERDLIEKYIVKNINKILKSHVKAEINRLEFRDINHIVENYKDLEILNLLNNNCIEIPYIVFNFPESEDEDE